MPANLDPVFSLHFNEEELLFDHVPVSRLADEFGTPLYVYSESGIRGAMKEFKEAAAGQDHMICFAMKSNSNRRILQIAAEEDLGADIVSGGELFRALRAGILPERIVFSGVGKSDREILEGMEAGIHLFSVESEMELERIAFLASQKREKVNVSIRVNPDVDAKTHPYISTGLQENKFGIDHNSVDRILRTATEHPFLHPRSIGFHIGSQLTDLGGYRDASKRLRELVLHLKSRGVPLDTVDVGGGLGIRYRNEGVPTVKEYIETIYSSLDFPEMRVLFEPGRRIVANAGIFITRILFRKNNGEKEFIICDGAMNDLIRPSLYQAHHEVMAHRRIVQEERTRADLVGPVCETGDFLAKGRELPNFQRGDLAVLSSAGAYGFVMASNYNSRPRSAEVLIGQDRIPRLIRKRETYETLIEDEI